MLHDEGLLKETRLVKPSACAVFEDRLQPGTVVNASSEIMCHIGHVSKGNYVHVRSGQQTWLAAAIAFLEIKHPLHGEPRFFMVCNKHTRRGPNLWADAKHATCTEVSNIVTKDVVRLVVIPNTVTLAQSGL